MNAIARVLIGAAAAALAYCTLECLQPNSVITLASELASLPQTRSWLEAEVERQDRLEQAMTARQAKANLLQKK